MKRKVHKKEYILLTFNASTVLSYDYMKSTFGYEPSFFNESNKMDGLDVGWKQSNIKMVIDDIINNSNVDLISVSEDEKNIRYHFIKYDE